MRHLDETMCTMCDARSLFSKNLEDLMTISMASTMKANSISSRSASRAVLGSGRRTLVIRAAVAVPKEV